MHKARQSVLEINLDALQHNYHYFKSRLNPETKFLAVVKAYGYGSHAQEIAKALEHWGADYLAVAYVHEGIALRDAGITLPILVLHPQPVNFKLAIDRCLEPSIYSPNILRKFKEIAKDQKAYPVHLKFNTGLNRLGFWENDVEFIVNELKDTSCIEIHSVFSHLAASDDLNEKDFTNTQIDSFNQIYSKLSEALNIQPIKHLLNTSGILNYVDAQFDMVRCGIGLHGYANDPDVDSELRPAATLKTIISQIHKIEPDETVGYNRAYASPGYQTTATLPIGHADGIGRHFGNGVGQVYVNGSSAPIIGNVCMDMLMIDITGIECNEGDEVIIFGGGHSAEVLAGKARTISYELITGISQRIPRIITGSN